MSFNFLNTTDELSSADLHIIEEKYAGKDNLESSLIMRLCNELRNLQHESKNPNYFYAGSKIHRQAILCRNNQINDLREELKKLKESTKIPLDT